jgi:L-arabinose isomerase
VVDDLRQPSCVGLAFESIGNMITNLASPEIWFVTGSQHLYGAEALKQVAANAEALARSLSAAKAIPLKVIFKQIVTRPEEVRARCLEANNDDNCAGLILWMHTFSPSKMWIGGLSSLQKPFLHLHTQFGRDLPWGKIDMDFMNLHQSAHGDREAGFIHTRMRLERKVVVGHHSDPEVHDRLAAWMRAVRAHHDMQGMKIARIGDNMREVAVTDGDKVAAEMRFGYAVNGYGVGDVVARVDAVSTAAVTRLCSEYEDRYKMAKDLRRGGKRHPSIRDAARIELGLRSFLKEGGFKGFTTSFEVLHGLKQLPGLAVQRLMADGYGFGAEGDWKTCALLRSMKVIGADLIGGTSFMEDYTYHLDPKRHLVLGAHMLEICESIASTKPSLERGPGQAGLQCTRRTSAQCLHRRPRQSLPASRKRSESRGPASPAAQTASGPGCLGMPAGFQDCVRGLDLCGWCPPHWLQLHRHHRAPRRLCRDERR